jgi:large subunit ribosomal protein L31
MMRGSAETPAATIKGDPLTQHPDTYLIDVVCTTCGTSFSIRSTAPTVSVDVCSSCHPAYTGVERAAFSGSRIERFNRRRSLAVA